MNWELGFLEDEEKVLFMRENNHKKGPAVYLLQHRIVNIYTPNIENPRAHKLWNDKGKGRKQEREKEMR